MNNFEQLDKEYWNIVCRNAEQ